MKRIVLATFCFLYFILLNFPLHSQDDTIQINPKKYFVGVTISSLLSAYPALQLTQHYNLNNKMTLELESAFSFGDFIFNSDFKKTLGFRIRPVFVFHVAHLKNNTTWSVRLFPHFRYAKSFYENTIIRSGGIYEETIKGTILSQLLGVGFGIHYHFIEYPSNHIHMGINLTIGRQFTQFSDDRIPIIVYALAQPTLENGKKNVALPFGFVHYLF